MNRTAEHDPISEFYRRLDVTDTTSAVSVILKLRGETCDIDCLYCYEKRKEAPGGARIDADQVRRLAGVFGGRALAVELHGGEPLTAGRDHVAAVLGELASQPSVVRVCLQTNGVLLDDQWLDLFDEVYPALRIGVSLDGDAEGNRWRVGYDGRPVYPRVAAALGLLAARGRAVGVIAAVTPAVLGRAEAVLDELATFSTVDAVSFVPCFDASVRAPTAAPGRRLSASRALQREAVGHGESGPGWAVTPEAYAEFVLAAAAHWIATGHFTRIKLEPVVSTIRRLRGLGTGFCHFSDLKCDHVFTLYPDGRLGSCDELPWPQARLTALVSTTDEEQVVSAQHSSALLDAGRSLMSRCVSCGYQGSCGGGCVATRLRYEATDDQDAYCDHRMRMIDGVAALLAAPAAAAGAWCRTLRWSPRQPNSMRDVTGFLAGWDKPATVRRSARLRTSAHGNINTVGEPGVHEADDLDPGHPQWRAAIEPGIWPLVEAITGGWGLVTYDSCEGHRYAGTALAPAQWRVGILPRDRAEYAAVAAALCRVAGVVGPALPSPVRVQVGRCDLSCESSGQKVPVLDLRLRPARGHGWDAYFAGIGQATATLLAAVRGESPGPGLDCGCGPPAGRVRR